MGDEFQIKISGDASSLVTSGKQAHDALNQGAEGAAKFELSGRELHETIAKLNTAGLGPLADSLKALVFGPGALVAIGVEGFSLFKDALSEFSKGLDEAMAKNADPTFLADIEAKKKAIAELSAQFDEYAAHARNAATATQAIRNALEGTVNVIKTTAENGGSLQDALFNLDVAKLKALLDQALITIDEFERAKAALEIKYRHSQESGKEKEIADQITAKKDALFDVNNELGNKDAWGKDYETRQKKDSQILIGEQHRLKEAQDRQKGLDDAAIAAEEKANALRNSPFGALGSLEYYTSGLSGKELQKKYDDEAKDARSLTDRNSADVLKYSDALPGIDHHVKNDEEKVREYHNDAQELRQEQQSLKQAIQDLTNQLRMMHENAGRVMPAQDAATALGTHAGMVAFARGGTNALFSFARQLEQLSNQINSPGAGKTFNH
jgi:hypothetical protein